ncbi:hypothetical protein [Janthinobacterium aquaticum]|nr:hypothetical protein [Janthinobacterium sp. FT58W]
MELTELAELLPDVMGIAMKYPLERTMYDTMRQNAAQLSTA